MASFTELLQQGPEHAWLFIPSAVLLGALHGLEPGHSKTMMASFIVAVRGTMKQAALLGLAATASHTAVIWVIAVIGLRFGRDWYGVTSEGYFQMVSAAIIVVIAAWMLAQTWRAHHAEVLHNHNHDHGQNHDHGHDHGHDDHARAHAKQIEERFSNRAASTSQIVMFGLTGGLIPCPAAITVLLICLQLQQFSLGMALVLCFSIGLALTLVASGVLAAWGMGRATARWPGFTDVMARAPYLSGSVILLMGAYMGWQGLQQITEAGLRAPVG